MVRHEFVSSAKGASKGSATLAQLRVKVSRDGKWLSAGVEEDDSYLSTILFWLRPWASLSRFPGFLLRAQLGGNSFSFPTVWDLDLPSPLWRRQLLPVHALRALPGG